MKARAFAIALLGAAGACSDSTSPADPSTTTGGISSCNSTAAPAIGAVSLATGSFLCVGGGASGAEFALVSFFATTAPSATTAFQVTASGITLPTLTADASPTFSFAVARPAKPSGPSPADSLDLALRTKERALIGPRLAAARRWQRGARGLSRNSIPTSASVGQLVTLNANADNPCSAATNRTARIVAITSAAIVVADTGNPSGGYTDAEYQSLGVAFDTLIDPLDRQIFGAPTDIDNNGKIILFFTKTVNDLTPATSQSYIGGFFFARDLFPIQATTDFDACPSSNVAEMFYVMVPDPTRGGAFTKANVTKEVLATLAHEYQHLINAARRMYVNVAATDFEEVWLNEGLSHSAEELLFYRITGLSPRQNLDVTALRAAQAYVDAFNDYAIGNFERYHDYIVSPSKYSPYAANDSLETRGATWSFLRYAADRHGTTDGDFWFQLVNSTTTGLANLQRVLGPTLGDQLRDWSTSVLTDDLGGFGATVQQPSWNFRSIYATLVPGNFPLATTTLTTSGVAVTLSGGASSYLRFAVLPNTSAGVAWNGAASTTQVSLVRLK
jgi:hypothetical protein